MNQFVFPERKFFLKTLIYTNVAISDSSRAFFAFFFGMLLKYLPFHPIAHTEFRSFFFFLIFSSHSSLLFLSYTFLPAMASVQQ